MMLRSYYRLLSRTLRVVTASNAADARVVVKRVRPDLAIVDLSLGHEPGLELVRQLKTESPDMRIAVTSTVMTIDLAVVAARAGAALAVCKPLTVSALVRRLVSASPIELDELKHLSLARMEYEYIARVVSDHGGNVTKAAKILGISRSTLQRKRSKSAPPE